MYLAKYNNLATATLTNSYGIYTKPSHNYSNKLN
jgi:hypothetical protein